MKANAELLAWHGWAFDRTCWEPWKDLLEDTCSIKLYDRGYWGAPQSIEVNEDIETTILFTHSFGLHLCPSKQLASADLIIVFGGFREFHPVAAQFNRRSKMVLNSMIQSLQEEPKKVLRDFLDNAYHPEDLPDTDITGFDGEKLLHDLHALNQSSLDVETLKQARKVCVLHGSSDKIVPKTKGRELYNILNEKASYFEVKDAGHALPFTNVEQCWAFIQPEIEKLQR